MNSLGRQFSVASSCASRGLRRKRWNNSALCAAGTRGRSLHTVRELPYPVEEGVGDFLPPAALKTVLEWQQGLLDRLNDQVKGTLDLTLWLVFTLTQLKLVFRHTFQK